MNLHLTKTHISDSPKIDRLPIQKSEEPNFQTAVQFREVNVRYGTKQVLKNINWTVNKGEKWAILGNNGLGKSTLLSLIYADHPQSYANNIVLLDHPRGKGETIWDIKKNDWLCFT